MDSENEFRFNYLSSIDFDNLIFLIYFLKLFRNWTVQTEGVKDFLNMILSIYDALFSYLKKVRILWGQNEFIVIYVKASWFKLNRYYGHTDDTSAYFIVIIFNSIFKIIYFE